MTVRVARTKVDNIVKMAPALKLSGRKTHKAIAERCKIERGKAACESRKQASAKAAA